MKRDFKGEKTKTRLSFGGFYKKRAESPRASVVGDSDEEGTGKCLKYLRKIVDSFDFEDKSLAYFFAD